MSEGKERRGVRREEKREARGADPEGISLTLSFNFWWPHIYLQRERELLNKYTNTDVRVGLGVNMGGKRDTEVDMSGDRDVWMQRTRRD